ncbi:NAD-P-binding protein [Mycena vulgaris]|nr:NAD-P-binding protein [Mycena vulgaris]
MSGNSFTLKTTAEQVADTFAHKIASKNVLITGTSLGGIGFETARAISKYANLVIITGYSSERLKLSEDAIKKDVPSANIRKLILDLSSLAAVRIAATEVNAYPEPLHVLQPMPLGNVLTMLDENFRSAPSVLTSAVINNAAAPIAPFKVTVDNLEMQMATGHVGPFLFTNLLVPKLIASATVSYTPRVVFVSSLAHAFDNGIDFATLAQPDPSKYDTMLNPYNETKSANVLTAIELSRRSHGKLNGYSLHPGTIETNIHHKPESEDAFKAYGVLDADGRPNPNFPRKTIPQGAATTVVAAFDPSLSDKPGAYLDDCKDASDKIAPHSSDPVNASELWAATEKLIGQSFEF